VRGCENLTVTQITAVEVLKQPAPTWQNFFDMATSVR